MIQPDLFAPRGKSMLAFEFSARLVNYLENVATWRTREQVQADTGLTPREIRAARQDSHGRVIYGQRGFRATSHATLEEIAACANTLESQAREMTRQAVRLRNLAHGRVGR